VKRQGEYKLSLFVKIIYLINITALVLFNTGCESLSDFFSPSKLMSVSSSTSQEVKQQLEIEEKKLEQWDAQLAAGQYVLVRTEVESYLLQKPSVQYWYPIYFTYGLAKEGLEDWAGALDVYQQIVDQSIERQMSFVALASYRRAYCYEILLENEKALAALSDALRLQNYLPLEITLAEIPARMASLYARFHQNSLSDYYTVRAERGLQKLKALKKDSNPEWIGKSLLNMGGVILTQIDTESFKQNILTLTRNQRYLIQAIELNHAKWSLEAQKNLLSSYSNLWSFITHYKPVSTMDWQLDTMNESSQKSELIGLYLEAIEKLKNYEAPEESTSFVQTISIYNQIKKIETDAVALLNKEMLKKPWELEFSGERSSRMPSSVVVPPVEVEIPIVEGLNFKPLPKKKTR